MIDKIAARVIALDYRELSEAARDRLLLALLANVSVAVAGAANTVLAKPAEPGKYRLMDGGTAACPASAAFWNAAAMHARTQDDFHPVGNLHIGTVVIPALLAAAQDCASSGADFLSALAAGYMVAVGLSRRFSPITTPRGLRSTCLYAPFGAAAAVGKLSGLSPEQLASSLAFAACFTGGTTQTWIDGGDEWQLHAALAAEGGYRSVEIAKRGAKGGARALDGPAGFYNAVAGVRPTFEELQQDFEPSRAIEEIAIKRYPVSGICQSVVLACERIALRLSAGREVLSIKVRMNPFELNYPGTQGRGPFESFSSKLMSAAFCAASTIVHREFDFSDFQGEPHPDVMGLVTRTRVEAEPTLPLLGALVEVELDDGSTADERLIDSRAQVAIDWPSIDEWAQPLWLGAGRTAQDYLRCRDDVRALPGSSDFSWPC